jgi:hypothetical protein
MPQAEGAYDGVERAIRHRQVLHIGDVEVDAGCSFLA